MARMSIFALASFLGEELKNILTMSSDSFGRNYLLSWLKIIVEILESLSLRVSSSAPGLTS